VPFQFVYLGVIIILVAIVIEGIYVLFASKISSKFRENEKYGIWLDRVVGTMLVGLGIKLALGSQTQ